MIRNWQCWRMIIYFGFDCAGYCYIVSYFLCAWELNVFNVERFGEFCSQGHTRYLGMVVCCFSLRPLLVHVNMIGIENRLVMFVFCNLRVTMVLQSWEVLIWSNRCWFSENLRHGFVQQLNNLCYLIRIKILCDGIWVEFELLSVNLGVCKCMQVFFSSVV
jgi:hypothetical protein